MQRVDRQRPVELHQLVDLLGLGHGKAEKRGRDCRQRERRHHDIRGRRPASRRRARPTTAAGDARLRFVSRGTAATGRRRSQGKHAGSRPAARCPRPRKTSQAAASATAAMVSGAERRPAAASAVPRHQIRIASVSSPDRWYIWPISAIEPPNAAAATSHSASRDRARDRFTFKHGAADIAGENDRKQPADAGDPRNGFPVGRPRISGWRRQAAGPPSSPGSSRSSGIAARWRRHRVSAPRRRSDRSGPRRRQRLMSLRTRDE